MNDKWMNVWTKWKLENKQMKKCTVDDSTKKNKMNGATEKIKWVSERENKRMNEWMNK